MLDYSPDEETLKNDKKKIAILISIIVFVIILIVLFIVIVILDSQRDEEQKKLSTTTRRTVNATEVDNNGDNTNQTTSNIISEEVTTTTSTTIKPTNKTKVTSNNGNKVTMTTVITSTSIKVVDILPPSVSHEITFDKSTYPDSLDAWEWQIVNLINAERKKNGLNELLVAKDLRQLAEEAADLWLGSGTEVVKEYLTGHSNYRKYTNYDDVTANSLYNDTIASTKVTTNSALRYLGVGVLYKNNTYYYVMIYE